jgi:hypothetical protein
LPAPNDVSLFVSGDQSRVNIDQLEDDPPVTDGLILFPFDGLDIGNQPFDFQPTSHLTVVTELLLRDGQSHQAQLVQFDVVAIPEPATCCLLLLGGVMLATGARNRPAALNS